MLTLTSEGGKITDRIINSHLQNSAQPVPARFTVHENGIGFSADWDGKETLVTTEEFAHWSESTTEPKEISQFLLTRDCPFAKQQLKMK